MHTIYLFPYAQFSIVLSMLSFIFMPSFNWYYHKQKTTTNTH